MRGTSPCMPSVRPTTAKTVSAKPVWVILFRVQNYSKKSIEDKTADVFFHIKEQTPNPPVCKRDFPITQTRLLHNRKKPCQRFYIFPIWFLYISHSKCSRFPLPSHRRQSHCLRRLSCDSPGIPSSTDSFPQSEPCRWVGCRKESSLCVQRHRHPSPPYRDSLLHRLPAACSRGKGRR